MDEQQIQIDPGILIETQRERLSTLTNENLMLLSLAKQQATEIESLRAQLKEVKENGNEDEGEQDPGPTGEAG